MERLDLISQLEQSIVWLTATAARLGGSRGNKGTKEWSFVELLGHIIASDEIVASRVLQVLVRPGVALASFDERRWAEMSLRSETTMEESLQIFTLKRGRLLKVLRNLSEREWAMTGVHEEAGELSIAEIVKTLSDHEAEHRAQAEAMKNLPS